MYIHFYGSIDHGMNNAKKQKKTASEALGLGGQASAKLDMILPKILGTNYENLIGASNQKIVYD